MYSVTYAALERDIRADEEYITSEYQDENEEEPLPGRADYNVPKSNPIKVIPAPPLVEEKKSNNDDISGLSQKSR